MEPEMRTPMQVGQAMSKLTSSHTQRSDETTKAMTPPIQNIPGYDRDKVKMGKRKLLDNGEGETADDVSVDGDCLSRNALEVVVAKTKRDSDGGGRTIKAAAVAVRRKSSDRGQACGEPRKLHTKEKNPLTVAKRGVSPGTHSRRKGNAIGNPLESSDRGQAHLLVQEKNPLTVANLAQDRPPRMRGVAPGTSPYPSQPPPLAPPLLNSGWPVTGATTDKLRIENRRHRQEAQRHHRPGSRWTKHTATFKLPPNMKGPPPDAGTMHPSGLALHHPAADHLFQYATKGCPAETGKDWTVEMMQAAIDRGPHSSAMEPDAMAYIQSEA